MIIPTSCVLEFLFQGKRYSAQILATVVMVLVGVGAACACPRHIAHSRALRARLEATPGCSPQPLLDFCEREQKQTGVLYAHRATCAGLCRT